MQALIHTEKTTKTLHYLQYQIAPKFSVAKTNLTLLPSEEVVKR